MSQFCDVCDIFVAGDLSQCDIFDGASWILISWASASARPLRGSAQDPGGGLGGAGLLGVLVIVLMVVGWGWGVNGWVSWVGGGAMR